MVYSLQKKILLFILLILIIIIITIVVIYYIFFHNTINYMTIKQFFTVKNSKYINIEDSYRERYFLKKLGFSKYLPRIFFTCKNETELKKNINIFKKPFMLKCNKGWRNQILVTSKSNVEDVFNKSKKWLYINHHNPLELGNKVKNLVYAEELITCSNKPCTELRAVVIKGSVKYIITPRGKISDDIVREIYDVETRKKKGIFLSISEIFFLLKKGKLHYLYKKSSVNNNKKHGIRDYNFKHINEIKHIGKTVSNYFMKPDILVIDFFITLNGLYIGETGLYPCGGVCFARPMNLLKEV